MLDVLGVGCFECWMFWVLDVLGVRCFGCWMFWVSDDLGVGCLALLLLPSPSIVLPVAHSS